MLFKTVPFRRSAAALFTGLFTLQLLMAGAVAACVPWDHPAQQASDTATVAGVHAAAGATHDGHDGQSTTTAINGATNSDEEPCNHPVSPEQCRTMASCAAGFLPALPSACVPATKVIETIVAALVTMPWSVSFPPERRPPRA